MKNTGAATTAGAKSAGKTNAVRTLEAAGIPFELHLWDCPEALSGTEVARVLDRDPDCVFKTLVTVGHSGQHYVFCIPVAYELDLKKAARAVGEKSIAMIRSRELLPLTGYIHGGCSPVGMKKSFPTVVDETAEICERIMVSGGRLGCQVELAACDLARAIPLRFADLTA